MTQGYPGKGHHALVDAGAASAHLRALQAKGVGYRQAAMLAGLDAVLVQQVRSGRLSHIRPKTAAKILGVPVRLAMGARVDAWKARRPALLLEREGFSRKEIGARVGLKTPEPSFDTETVTVRTALAVRALYRSVTEDGPEEPAA